MTDYYKRDVLERTTIRKEVGVFVRCDGEMFDKTLRIDRPCGQVVAELRGTRPQAVVVKCRKCGKKHLI